MKPWHIFIESLIKKFFDINMTYIALSILLIAISLLCFF